MSDLSTALRDAAEGPVAPLDHDGLRRRAQHRDRVATVSRVTAVAAVLAVGVAVVPNLAPSTPVPEVAGAPQGDPSIWDGRLTSPAMATEPEGFQRYIHPDEFASVVGDCAADADVELRVTGNGTMLVHPENDDAGRVQSVVQACLEAFPIARGVPAPPGDRPVDDASEPVASGESTMGWSNTLPPDLDAAETLVLTGDWGPAMESCLSGMGFEGFTGEGDSLKYSSPAGQDHAAADRAVDACGHAVVSVIPQPSTVDGPVPRAVVDGTALGAMVDCLRDNGIDAEVEAGGAVTVDPTVYSDDLDELRRTLAQCTGPTGR